MDLKEELRIMVKYILPEEDQDNDIVENYVDTFALINEEYIKQLKLTVVMQQRELLIDFYSKQRGGMNNTNKDAIIREVDNYLSINCA